MSDFSCIECGAQYVKWVGKCTFCNNWNTVSEHSDILPSRKSKKSAKIVETQSLLEDRDVLQSPRFPSGLLELDRVLGGGIVKSSAVLIGGEPGIGKSTLMIHIAGGLAEQNLPVVYISGEESIQQVSMRATRILKTIKGIEVLQSVDLNTILALIEQLKNKSAVIIVDSVQTIHSDEIPSAPGSIAQVRTVSYAITTFAKTCGVTVFFVGHINKEGQIAGPKVLEHMVDVVLYFEEDQHYGYRILKSVKNRFGKSGEIGVFRMLETGFAEVPNPSELFLTKRNSDSIGLTTFASIEGSRALLITVEALLSKSYNNMPRRNAVGYDSGRLAMIIAVLSTHLRMKLYDQEVYLNIAGGMKIEEPSVDLAVAAALYSCMNEISVPSDVIFVGEVGLSGDIRSARSLETRISEGLKLGFKKIICGADIKYDGIKVIKMQNITDLPKVFNSFKQSV